jgi:hypothetical protein
MALPLLYRFSRLFKRAPMCCLNLAILNSPFILPFTRNWIAKSDFQTAIEKPSEEGSRMAHRKEKCSGRRK